MTVTIATTKAPAVSMWMLRSWYEGPSRSSTPLLESLFTVVDLSSVYENSMRLIAKLKTGNEQIYVHIHETVCGG